MASKIQPPRTVKKKPTLKQDLKCSMSNEKGKDRSTETMDTSAMKLEEKKLSDMELISFLREQRDKDEDRQRTELERQEKKWLELLHKYGTPVHSSSESMTLPSLVLNVKIYLFFLAVRGNGPTTSIAIL